MLENKSKVEKIKVSSTRILENDTITKKPFNIIPSNISAVAERPIQFCKVNQSFNEKKLTKRII
jgi:hypothetical protein